MTRKVYIDTYGCQMNEYDSQQMLQVLATKGFEQTNRPDDAQLILLNSCAVREKSENKALSSLGRYSLMKKSDPSKVIGFGGCVGQTEGPRLVKRFPFLDFSFGTNNYRDLPTLIEPYESLWSNANKNADVTNLNGLVNTKGIIDERDILLPASRPEAKCQAFITITNGCDKFCSYCIVPFTRGRELSRSPEDILTEAESLVARGVKEIMLLGQNVNSYWGKDSRGAYVSLYDLLKLFQDESDNRLKGLQRLRYTTSHPRDFDEPLARAFQEFPILCEYLHLPFQSGSDSVLRRMRRFYTAESYLKKIDMVKRYCPDIALSTDIIVGFPGETDEDFKATMTILKALEFDNVYAFKYSVRPYTRSAEWPDDIAESVKSERIEALFTFQKEMSRKKYAEDLGKSVEVMLEGPSKSKPEVWTGRSRKNRVVHIPFSAEFREGHIMRVTITDAHTSWLMAA